MANCVASRWVWTLVRLHEKGGKLHTMPCQHNLEAYLKAYLEASGRPSPPDQDHAVCPTSKLCQ